MNREGGFIALDPLASGQMVVVVDGIQPPLTHGPRRYRKRLLRLALGLTARLFAIAVACLLISALTVRVLELRSVSPSASDPPS